MKGCDPDYQKHVSSQLLGFQHPQNSKLLNQRMERSNQDQEQLRLQLGLTRSAFETWLFFQEATARPLAEQLPKPDKKKKRSRTPKDPSGGRQGCPFVLSVKTTKKKTTFPSLHTTFARQVQKAQLKI